MLREQRELEDHAEHDDQHHALAAQRDEEIQQLYHLLHQKWNELEEGRHSQSVYVATSTDTTPQAAKKYKEIHQIRRRLQEVKSKLAGHSYPSHCTGYGHYSFNSFTSGATFLQPS